MSLCQIQCLSISQKGPYQIFHFLSFSNKGVKWSIFPLTDHLDSKFSPDGPNASPCAKIRAKGEYDTTSVASQLYMHGPLDTWSRPSVFDNWYWSSILMYFERYCLCRNDQSQADSFWVKCKICIWWLKRSYHPCQHIRLINLQNKWGSACTYLNRAWIKILTYTDGGLNLLIFM